MVFRGLFSRFLCLVTLMSLLTVAPALAQPASIGVNIDYATYWDSSGLWANVMKHFSAFTGATAWTTDGFPRSTGSRAIYNYEGNSWPESVTGTPSTYYRLTYQGGANGYGHIVFHPSATTFTYAPGSDGIPTYNSGTNTWSAKVLFNDNGTNQIWIYINYDAAGLQNGLAIDPIYNVKIMRPDCADTDIFSPDYLKRVKPFKALRMMDFTATNSYVPEYLGTVGVGDDNPSTGLYYGAATATNGGGKAFKMRYYYLPDTNYFHIRKADGTYQEERRGIGCYPTAQLDYSLNSKYSLFHTRAGIDQSATGNPTATFEVWADGVLRWSSGSMTKTSTYVEPILDVRNVTTLTLKVTGAPDGNAASYADFCDMYLWRDLQWANRPPYNYFTSQLSWRQRGDNNDGTPLAWEYGIQLANASGCNPWFCIPVNASDSYVQSLALLIRDGNAYTGPLNSGRTAYIEYTNEAWNYMFNQYHYLEKTGSLSGLGEAQAYAKRTKEINAIFRTVFSGQLQRVHLLFAGQGGYTAPASAGLQYIQTNYGAPSQFFHSYAIAPYLHWNGETISSTTTLDQFMPMVQRDLENSASVWITNSKTFADSYSLPMIAYEGGTEFYDSAPWQKTLFENSYKDRRMGDIYENLLAKWQQSGGGLFAHFKHVTTDSRWQLLLHGRQMGSHKWDALMRKGSLVGDVDNDGTVGYTDFCLLRDNFGGNPTTSPRWWMQGDVNGDNVIDLADYNLMYPNLTGLTGTQQTEVNAFPATHHIPVIASLQQLVTWKDHAKTIAVSATDTLHSTFTFTQVNAPRHGSINIATYPYIAYTPTASYVGADEFLVAVSDGTATSNTLRVEVMVNAKPDTSILALFPMNENTGTTITDTVNANTGTFGNTPTWTPGKSNSGLDFDYTTDGNGIAVPDYVKTASSSTLNTAINNPYTFSAWVYPKALPAQTNDSTMKAGIITKHNWCGVAGLIFTKENSTQGKFRMRHSHNWGDNVVEAASSLVNLNQWYLVTATVNQTAGDVKIYVNGALQGTTHYATPPIPLFTNHEIPFYIGAGKPYIAGEDDSYKFRWPFKGIIDEVRIYNRVLSDSDVLGLYQGVISIAPTVSIATPANGAVIAGYPANVTFTATASDVDGDVTKVEYYQGSTKIGESLATPFTYNWTNVTAGNYTITAVATDNDGAMTTSAPISISVYPVPTSGLTTWMKADAITGKSNGNPVTSWADSYNTNTYVLNAGAVNQPTYISSWQNGKPALQFNSISATGGYFEIPNAPSMANASLFVVGRFDTDNNWQLLWQQGQACFGQTYANDPQARRLCNYEYEEFYTPGGPIYTPNDLAPHVYGFRFDSSSRELNRDAGAAQSTAYAMGIGTGTLRMGGYATRQFAGKIAEVIVYNRKVTTTERDSIMSYLRTKYAISNGAAPTVTLVSSAYTLTAPGACTLTATPADSDGTISKVAFYNGATKLGEDTSSPYTRSLSGLARGTYYYYAKTYDNLGNIGLSTTITITVN